jgi:hypothetical protein
VETRVCRVRLQLSAPGNRRAELLQALLRFNFHVFESNFDRPVQFSWELEGATFLEKKCDGFSVCVWITTKDLKDEALTEDVWSQAILFLTEFLKQQPAFPLPMIYLPPAAAVAEKVTSADRD